MRVRVGQSLVSGVDTTAVIVVRAPAEEVMLTCGGAEMAEAAQGSARVAPAADPAEQPVGTLLGKRYVDDELGLEVLCVKAGPGTLAVGGKALSMKAAKALPASD